MQKLSRGPLFRSARTGTLATQAIAHSKFVFIEFSIELMNVIKLYEHINVGQTDYKLKGMVQSYNKHFTCAVLIQGKWTYIDDLCSGVKEFTNLTALIKKFTQG